MKRRAVILTLALTMLAGVAHATVGGPLVVRFLGWDATNERAYCRQVGWDESLERECIYYFDLRSAHPDLAHVVPWSVGAHQRQDTSYTKSYSSLRRRLRTLETDFARAVPVRVKVISDSTVDVRSFSLRRFVVEVDREPASEPPAELRVTTYRSAEDVRVLCEYLLPGHSERLAIVSCIGDPDEGGYEVQRAVILGPRAAKPQVLDNWRGVMAWPKP